MSYECEIKFVKNKVLIATLQVRPILHDEIKEAQSKDPQLQEKIEKVKQGEDKEFNIQNDILMMGSRICVLDIDNLHQKILEETHTAPYAMHPEITKMYNTLRPHYWWPKMKKDVADYISKCLTCQQVSRTPGSSWKVETIVNYDMEVGKNNDGFCAWITKNSKKE